MKYKENKIFCFLILNTYRINNRLVRKIIRMFLRRKGGGFYSKTLRKILAEYHGVRIGLYSMHIGDHYAHLPRGTTIGRYCSISKNVIVINGSHPIQNKSTHAFFYEPRFKYVNQLGIKRRTELTIGHDVYIGMNVIILPNVTRIGTGAVIAAGSVVIKNVPPFAIVGGNPAKLIRYRFSEETIKKILASKWWEKDIDQLHADSSEFYTFLSPLER